MATARDLDGNVTILRILDELFSMTRAGTEQIDTLSFLAQTSAGLRQHRERHRVQECRFREDRDPIQWRRGTAFERPVGAGHFYAEKAGFWETRDTFQIVALAHAFSDQLVLRRRLASSTETTPVFDMAPATCAISSPTAPAAIAMFRACKAICPR